MEAPKIDGEVIGGRVLRNRRSLATAKTEEKENVPVLRTKTPAKTPRRKSSVNSKKAVEKPVQSFASLKVSKIRAIYKKYHVQFLEFSNFSRGFSKRRNLAF
jgi:hypothetical protein